MRPFCVSEDKKLAAKSSSVVYAYAVQVDKDTAATGTFTALNKRDGGGFSSSGEDSDTDSSSGRHKQAAVLGSVTHSASFDFDFGASIHDDFLRSAYAGAWVDQSDGEDELTIGTTPVYFTFVIYAPYLTSTKQYTQFVGCQVTSAGFTFPKDSGGVVGLSIDLAAVNRTFPTSAPWTTLNDAPVATKLKTCDVLSVKVDDVEIPSVIDSLDYTITSENESVFDIRQCDAVEVLLDDAETGGTLVMLHDDDSDDYHRDAASGTEFKLEIGIDAGDVEYRIVSTRTANRATGPDYTNDNVSVSVPFGSIVAPSIYRTNS